MKKCPTCGSPFEFDELGGMVECCSEGFRDNYPDYDLENEY